MSDIKAVWHVQAYINNTYVTKVRLIEVGWPDNTRIRNYEFDAATEVSGEASDMIYILKPLI